jgi:hypothetical protein
MSTVVHKQDGLVVVDDLLPAPTFHAIRNDLSHGEYRPVHATRWDKAWRLWDGQPLRGESTYYDPDRVFGWRGATYPTGSALDPLIDAIRRVSREWPGIAGIEGVDWLALYLSPWLYPVGAALALHQDTGRYSGSFTYFAHPRWNVGWGGELLVSPARPPGAPPVDDARDSEGEPPWMSDDATAATDDVGLATCVAPRPNRLVLLGPHNPHRICRIDVNAGAHLRVSVAGFLMSSR